MLLRVLIFVFLVAGFNACQSEQPPTENATISLEEIKPSATTVAMKAEVAENPNVAPDDETTIQPTVELVTDTGEKTVEKKTKRAEPAPEVPKKVVKEQKKAPRASSKKPVIKFEKTTHYFGLIDEGETISTKFWFDNVGDAPLLIKDASATCGCTYPGFPFVPIKPGERSSINVSFNSKGKFGKQKPVVTVVTNASSQPIKLYLEGEVKTEVAEN